MNILANIEELHSWGTLSRANFSSSAYLFIRQTPAHSFTTAIMPILDQQCVLLLTARDNFDEELAKMVMVFLSKKIDILNLKNTITILDGFYHEGYGFNAVVVLGPDAHHMFQVHNKSLHTCSFEVFPIFRCEFSGDESSELVNEIRHDSVDTLDWKRAPSPKVYIRFNNMKTGGGTIGAKWILTKVDSVLLELQGLTDEARSFIEIKNYKEEICRIIVEDDNFLVSFSQFDSESLIPRGQIKSRVECFLRES